MNNSNILIKAGKILIYRLYDVAYEIDLLKVEEQLKREARRLRWSGRLPINVLNCWNLQ